MSVNAHTAIEEMEALEKQIADLRKRLVELRREAGTQAVSDYSLNDRNGQTVQLSSLFGPKDDLIIIHNMGKGCRYCTLWADGFQGVHQHSEDRAGFALVSPDEPSKMGDFAESRGWTFTTLSNHGGTFTADMGFEKDGKCWPGFSTFHRDPDGSIHRVGFAYFGPGDDFCALWHLFDLLKDGSDGWEPQYSYGPSAK